MTWDPGTTQGKKVFSALHISFGLFCREFKTAYSETSRDRKWDESMVIYKSSPIRLLWGHFPGGSDGKVSVYNAGDPGSIPGLGIPWRRKWQSTLVLLSGKSHGQRSLLGYSPWGHKESDTTERLHSLTHSRLLWYSIKEILRSYRMNWNRITFLIRRMEWMDLSGNSPYFPHVSTNRYWVTSCTLW